MAKRHGIIIKENEVQFKMGIWRVFDPWTDGKLLWAQGYNIEHEEKRPLYIEHHFRRVTKRLFISLNRLYSQLREYDKFIEDGGLAGPNPGLSFEIPEEIGIAADSVVHYLNLFAEDLARIIRFVLIEEVPKNNPKDDPSTLFRILKDEIIYKKIHTSDDLIKLFSSLNDNSWWSLALKRESGIRQRLVHYTDLIYCRASTKPGDSKMTADVDLIRIGTSKENLPLEKTLKELLTDLCNWLDDLENFLLPILIERLSKKHVQWSPLEESIPSIFLPIPCADRFDISTFYMPECTNYKKAA